MASRRADTAFDPKIPDKAYFRIGEVARIASVATSVLRFWETQFRILKPEKTRTNQRVYARDDVEMVLRIRSLLYDRGFTIDGARRHLATRGAAKLPGDLVARLKK